MLSTNKIELTIFSSAEAALLPCRRFTTDQTAAGDISLQEDYRKLLDMHFFHLMSATRGISNLTVRFAVSF